MKKGEKQLRKNDLFLLGLLVSFLFLVILIFLSSTVSATETCETQGECQDNIQDNTEIKLTKSLTLTKLQSSQCNDENPGFCFYNVRNVTFDCQGNTLNTTVKGLNIFVIKNSRNIKIKNCIIDGERKADRGIYFIGYGRSIADSVIEKTQILKCEKYGIDNADAKDVLIKNSFIHENIEAGIKTGENSGNTTILESVITNNRGGIYFQTNNMNYIYNSTVLNNADYDVRIRGDARNPKVYCDNSFCGKSECDRCGGTFYRNWNERFTNFNNWINCSAYNRLQDRQTKATIINCTRYAATRGSYFELSTINFCAAIPDECNNKFPSYRFCRENKVYDCQGCGGFHLVEDCSQNNGICQNGECKSLGPPTTNCSSCEECREKLSEVGEKIVKLITNISTNSTCINLSNVNNKIFDCQGYTINGSKIRGNGIYLKNAQNFRLGNCTIINFSRGVLIEDSNNISIENFTIINTRYDGVKVENIGSFFSLENSTILNNSGNGVYIKEGTNLSIINNKILNSRGPNTDGGLILKDIKGRKEDNVVKSNKICDNKYYDLRIVNSNLTLLNNSYDKNLTYSSNILVSGTKGCFCNVTSVTITPRCGYECDIFDNITLQSFFTSGCENVNYLQVIMRNDTRISFPITVRCMQSGCTANWTFYYIPEEFKGKIFCTEKVRLFDSLRNLLVERIITQQGEYACFKIKETPSAEFIDVSLEPKNATINLNHNISYQLFALYYGRDPINVTLDLYTSYNSSNRSIAEQYTTEINKFKAKNIGTATITGSFPVDPVSGPQPYTKNNSTLLFVDTPPSCPITTATIVALCREGPQNCKVGDKINMTIFTNQYCINQFTPSKIKVYATNYSECNFWMENITTCDLISKNCNATWSISSIPEKCAGKAITAVRVEFYNSTNLLNSSDGNFGSFTFWQEAPPTACNITNASIKPYCGDDGCNEREKIQLNITVEDTAKCLNVRKLEINASLIDEAQPAPLGQCRVSITNTTTTSIQPIGKSYLGNWTVSIPKGCEGKQMKAVVAALYNGTERNILIAKKSGNFGSFTFAGVAPRKQYNLSVDTCGDENRPPDGNCENWTVKGNVIVNGSLWGKAPQSRMKDVSIYNVSFGSVEGWYKPADILIYLTQNTSLLGVYTKTQINYVLIIVRAKNETGHDIGAPIDLYLIQQQQRLVNSSINEVSYKYTDSYPVYFLADFKDVPGYLTPENLTITITGFGMFIFEVIYKKEAALPCQITNASIKPYCGYEGVCDPGEKIGLNITVKNMDGCRNVNKIEIHASEISARFEGTPQTPRQEACSVVMANTTPIQIVGNNFIANWTVSISDSCKGKQVQANKASIYNGSNKLIGGKIGWFGSFKFASEVGGCYCNDGGKQYSCGACISGSFYECKNVNGRGQIVANCTRCNNCPTNTQCYTIKGYCISLQADRCRTSQANQSVENCHAEALCFWDKPRMLLGSYCEVCFAVNGIPKTCFDYVNETACVYDNSDRCGIGPFCLGPNQQPIPNAQNCRCYWNGSSCGLSYTIETPQQTEHCSLTVSYGECGKGKCGPNEREVILDYSNQTGYTDCTANDQTFCQPCELIFEPLPFFSWWNIIAVIVLLIIGYALILKRKLENGK